MKKIIYMILIAFASNLVLSSCTEEKVEPTSANIKSDPGTPSEPY